MWRKSVTAVMMMMLAFVIADGCDDRGNGCDDVYGVCLKQQSWW